MTSGIFDDITRAFLAALDAGTLSLGAYSLPLLGAFALIGWYWTFGRALVAGGQIGDALAGAISMRSTLASPTGCWSTSPAWRRQRIRRSSSGGCRGREPGVWTTAHAVAGGRSGFSDCRPAPGRRDWHDGDLGRVQVAADRAPGPGRDGHCDGVPLVALALMVAQIEYHLSVLVGAMLIPFGMFGPTAFLTEFCIGWMTGGSCACS